MRNLQDGKAAGYSQLSNRTERIMVTGSNRSVYRSSRRGFQSSDIRKRFSKRFLRTIDNAARCLVFAAFVVAWGSSVPSAQAAEEIFVASGGSTTNTYNLNSVRVYNRLGNGNVSPNRTLAGSNTELRTPSGVAIDTIHDELFVANRGYSAPSITVYDLSANGNTPPKRIISGSRTELGTPRGLAIDTTNGKLLVTNEVSHEILIYPLGADGDVAPRVIAGAATKLKTPWGIVVDHVHNELFVSNKDGHSITVYDLTAVYDNASDNLAPLRIVTDPGPITPLRYPRGIAVDLHNDELIVASQGNSTIAVYPRTANGNTSPKRRLSGPATGLDQPLGLILDLPNNELLVSNLYPRSSVVVFTRAAHGNIPPLRTLTLAGSGEPVFLAVTTETPEPFLLQVKIAGAGSVTSDPPGIDCSSTGNIEMCQATFTVSSHVTLTARTAGVSDFAGWGGDCSEAGRTTLCLVTMAHPQNVTATFVAHSLTATDPSGTPNPTTSGGAVSLSMSATDSLDHPLSHIWSALCPTALGSHGTFNNPVNQTPTWTAPTNTTGVEQTCMIAVTVSDGNGLSQERSYAQRVSPATPPPPPSQPTVDLILNGSTFHTGQTVNYQASIAQGSQPSSDRVDIYLGVLLPDGVTFASFVQTPSGFIAISLGSSPIPFRTNVVFTASDIIPLSYTFSGSEPVGTYLTYAGLVRAGTDPLQASNRLALVVKGFDFTP